MESLLRVGIHSGRPTLSVAGYIGLSVQRTARLCSVAHGGQIIVSAATRAAIGDSTPAGIRFRRLGRRRLPGLPDPDVLFQVQAQGLQATFLRPRAARGAVLPPPADRRGGRKRERANLGQLELPQLPAN